MTISDANPIQFWPTGAESYNEKTICGVYSECFCQPAVNGDVLDVQLSSPNGGQFELVEYDEDYLIQNNIDFVEVSDGVFSAPLTIADSFLSLQATELTLPSADYYYAIENNGLGRWVGVTFSGTVQIATSDDNWATSTSRTSPSTRAWTGIAYGNGLWVAVAFDGTAAQQVAYSSDNGVTWAAATAAANIQWVDLAFGNGVFVAIANSGANRAMYSTDGINWTISGGIGAKTWGKVAFGNGLFVAVSATAGAGNTATSPDGITWTARNGSIDSCTGVTYGQGLFVAVGGNGVMTSPDGVNWTTRTVPVTRTWRRVSYGDGIFVAMTGSGAQTVDNVMFSTDGVLWYSAEAVAGTPAGVWGDIKFDNIESVFIVTRNSGSGNWMSLEKTTPSKNTLKKIYKIFDVSNIEALAGFVNRETGGDLDWTITTKLVASTLGTETTNYGIGEWATFSESAGTIHTITYDIEEVSGNGGDILTLYILDANFNELGSVSLSGGSFPSAARAQGTLNITTYADGKYLAVEYTGFNAIFNVYALSSQADDELFHSDCIEVSESDDCTELITYDNTTDFDGLVFENSGSPSGGPFHLRVPAQFWKEENPQEEEDHELSNGQIVTLRQKIEEKRLLELGFMPNYMHKKLQKILMMDSILIDGEYWKRRDSYESDNINRYGLKKGQVWLTKYDSVKKNTP